MCLQRHFGPSVTTKYFRPPAPRGAPQNRPRGLPHAVHRIVDALHERLDPLVFGHLERRSESATGRSGNMLTLERLSAPPGGGKSTWNLMFSSPPGYSRPGFVGECTAPQGTFSRLQLQGETKRTHARFTEPVVLPVLLVAVVEHGVATALVAVIFVPFPLDLVEPTLRGMVGDGGSRPRRQQTHGGGKHMAAGAASGCCMCVACRERSVQQDDVPYIFQRCRVCVVVLACAGEQRS